MQGVAQAAGIRYLKLRNNSEIGVVIEKALQTAAGNQPVIVDVDINYSKRSRFTKGIVQTNLGRFPLGEKVRFIGRALKRKITG